MGSDRGAFDTQLAFAHFIDLDKIVRAWICDMQVASFEKMMPLK
jgi:hypothetical protein